MLFFPDEELLRFFTPERIKAEFIKYELTKTDRITKKIDIPTGADGISYKAFKEDIEFRSNNIARRISNNTYQFYPYREIKIPKPDGGERVLSIASIRDVLVQRLLYEATYRHLERLFNKTLELNLASFAYRKGKSAPLAAKLIHRHIERGFCYALDADIVKFFDNISHDKLTAKVQDSFGLNTMTTSLLERFFKTNGTSLKLKTPGRRRGNCHHRKPGVRSRRIGIPQGGVLSGMLANLYLHDFDKYIVEDLSKQYELKYVRYADDFIVLLRRGELLVDVHAIIGEKLSKLELELHKEPKTKHVYIQNKYLNFVGFAFSTDCIEIQDKNVQKFKERISAKLFQESSYETGSNTLYRFKFLIKNVINRKVLGCGAELCNLCGGVNGDRARSWIGFFSVTTNVQQLYELDKWIRQSVSVYFYRKYGLRLKRSDFRNARLASLSQEFFRLKGVKKCECINSAEVI
ncbi:MULTISPECIES: reverse transcriptase domain-containing protein [Cyanophyceae]|uniref:Reverse transcriptase domain-containing protein n=1 Tax=Leptolyngbya subtilissima DQ-A4 TaxID=2933933 RepID=A0ABV0K5Q7_9CYAN|nr:reverse transcriptase domain-containing protein [Nodosilinea sp. FACHB-141]MBD2112801.1 hypothetical protein [Nodosilinea sp. FACHB-141]